MIKRLDPEYLISHPQRKREAMMWMNDHGVNPNHVPMDATIEFLSDGRLEIELWEEMAGQKFVTVDGTYPFPMDVLM